MGFVIHTPEARAAITELPITALKTDQKLQMRNVGMQKVRDDNDAKRYQAHIKDLARSIRREGQLTPIRVVADDKDGLTYALAEDADNSHPIATRFWLVDGHHRFAALQQLGVETVKVIVLEGMGFDAALVASKLSNSEVVQGVSRHERIENAWSALNLPSDYFRALPVKEAAKLLGVGDATIKRMRQAIRDEAIDKGAIDTTQPRPEQERQFMRYWGRGNVIRQYSLVTWAIHSKGRRQFNEPSSDAKVFQIKRVLVQHVLGDDGRYSNEEVRRALSELGVEAKEHGISHLDKKYKPHVTQGDSEDEEDGALPLPSRARGEDF